ncbi:MAG: phosphonate ABC transporter, permease protein PhnE [Bauldia sp.]
MSATQLRQEALAGMSDLRARYPEQFSIGWARRLPRIVIPLLLVALAGYAFVTLDVSPERFWRGLGRLGTLIVPMFPPDPGPRLWPLFEAMGETLAIAFLGTLTAAVLAFPFALLAAKNVIPNIFVHFGVRRVFDVIRSIDVLIWALMWISVVGLGPFAGVLAVATSDFGSFGKLFSEAIEATDRKAAEGVAASGGSRLHQVRFGLLPQVLPVIASQILYFFESNTRSATIIGIVGAGGIGVYLSEAIRVLELQELLFTILMILVVVSIIDFVSTRLRMSIIGRQRIEM